MDDLSGLSMQRTLGLKSFLSMTTSTMRKLAATEQVWIAALTAASIAGTGTLRIAASVLLLGAKLACFEPSLDTMRRTDTAALPTTGSSIGQDEVSHTAACCEHRSSGPA